MKHNDCCDNVNAQQIVEAMYSGRGSAIWERHFGYTNEYIVTIDGEELATYIYYIDEDTNTEPCVIVARVLGAEADDVYQVVAEYDTDSHVAALCRHYGVDIE